MIGIERFIQSFSTISEADLGHYKPDFGRAIDDYRNKRLPFYLQELIFEDVGKRFYLNRVDLRRAYRAVQELSTSGKGRDLEIAKFFLHGYYRELLEELHNPMGVRLPSEERFEISSERYSMVRNLIAAINGKVVLDPVHIAENNRPLPVVQQRGIMTTSPRPTVEVIVQRVEQGA